MTRLPLDASTALLLEKKELTSTRWRRQLIQLDTRHLRPEPGVERRQVTVIDVVSRVAVLGVRGRVTADTATAVLDELQARMLVPIGAIPVDGGLRSRL